MAKARKNKSTRKKAPARPKGVPKCAPRDDKSFYFMDIVNVIKHTGHKAATLKELRDGIAEVSNSSLFHHTCQFFLKGKIQEHTNDFALWVSTGLEESALAEQLSIIDPYSFASMASLRKHFLKVIGRCMKEFPEPRPALPGEAFFFNEAATFLFPAGLRARNLAEFLMAIKHVDSSSIYYHFYEARARLKRGTDDFSKWIDEVHKAPGIAKRLRAIDPFMNNLEHVREQIASILEEGIKSEMEEMA
jgi:hypothetical protein